jgi:hypothetical protein
MKLEGAARVYAPVLAVLGLVLLLFVANRPLYVHHGHPRQVESGPVGAEAGGARYRLDAASAKSSGARLLSDDARRAGFRFEASTAPADRQIFLDAVAAARPEAQRLIGLVDGLVTVRIGPTSLPGAIGLTEDLGSRYRVTIDLGLVATRYGPRGIQRTVLHELGHVVDLALVTDDAMAGLDAGIPAGLGCEEGKLGGCANREERFAESFAKWALGDIGVNLEIGYKVPPPSAPLDVWGAPLARLAASA